MERTRIPKLNLAGEPDHVWLRAIGRSLFGDRWLRSFAASLGIDHATLHPLVREKDPRPLSPNMRAKINAWLDEKFDMLIQEHRNRLLLIMDSRDHFGASRASREARLKSTSIGKSESEDDVSK